MHFHLIQGCYNKKNVLETTVNLLGKIFFWFLTNFPNSSVWLLPTTTSSYKKEWKNRLWTDWILVLADSVKSLQGVLCSGGVECEKSMETSLYLKQSQEVYLKIWKNSYRQRKKVDYRFEQTRTKKIDWLFGRLHNKNDRVNHFSYCKRSV